MADEGRSQLITPPNTLKGKVKVGGPGAVDAETLERAEQVIAGMSQDYLEWVEEDLSNIDAAFTKLKAGDGDRAANLERIFQISHDMKGQGGSFGYHMMTQIGDKLCRFIEGIEGAGPDESVVIGLHIDAMKLVIANRMEGDGGKEGGKLFAGLEQVVKKVGAS